MLIEVAHAISRTKADSKLKQFYFRIKSRHGAKVAVVALTRKVICILHHLIVNREMFEDEATNKSKRIKPGRSSSSPGLIISDAIQILVRAGYVVQKDPNRKEDRSKHPPFRIAFMVKRAVREDSLGKWPDGNFSKTFIGIILTYKWTMACFFRLKKSIHILPRLDRYSIYNVYF